MFYTLVGDSHCMKQPQIKASHPFLTSLFEMLKLIEAKIELK